MTPERYLWRVNESAELTAIAVLVNGSCDHAFEVEAFGDADEDWMVARLDAAFDDL